MAENGNKEIQRATLFKLKEEGDVDAAVEKYAQMKADSKKDSAPYILSLTAGRVPTDDPRTSGYNLAAFATFSSLEDMKYFDEQDEAHGALKAFMKGKVAGPPLVVYFSDATGGGAFMKLTE